MAREVGLVAHRRRHRARGIMACAASLVYWRTKRITTLVTCSGVNYSRQLRAVMRLTYILIVAALLVISLIGNEVISNNSSVSRAESQPAQVTLPSRPWQDVDPKTPLNAPARNPQEPRSHRALKLNVELLQTILRRAPQESLGSKKNEITTLDLPTPDAGFIRFNIGDSPIWKNHWRIATRK